MMLHQVGQRWRWKYVYTNTYHCASDLIIEIKIPDPRGYAATATIKQIIHSECDDKIGNTVPVPFHKLRMSNRQDILTYLPNQNRI